MTGLLAQSERLKAAPYRRFPVVDFKVQWRAPPRFLSVARCADARNVVVLREVAQLLVELFHLCAARGFTRGRECGARARARTEGADARAPPPESLLTLSRCVMVATCARTRAWFLRCCLRTRFSDSVSHSPLSSPAAGLASSGAADGSASASSSASAAAAAASASSRARFFFDFFFRFSLPTMTLPYPDMRERARVPGASHSLLVPHTPGACIP